MDKVKEYLLSAALGLFTGALGTYLMGFLAAITIPKYAFEWLDENLSVLTGMIILDAFFQFLAFGISGIISGLLIIRFKRTDWRANALVYFSSYILYVTVGISIIYKTKIVPPVSIWYLKQTLGLPYLVLPLCVAITAYFANKRIMRLSA